MATVKAEVDDEVVIVEPETIHSSIPHVGCSFFRVLVQPPSVFVKQLRLPVTFRVHMPTEKQQKSWQRVELLNPKGMSWKVNLSKDPEGLHCFKGDGWHSLATAHKLKIGYFLIFDYDGVQFKFRIYGLDTKEIEDYPSPTEGRVLFEAVIHFTNLCKDHLNIPKACKRLYDVARDGGNTKVILVDAAGTEWPMSVMHRMETETKMRSYFSAGWLHFARGSGLRKGDKCVFKEADHNFIKVDVLKNDR